MRNHLCPVPPPRRKLVPLWITTGEPKTERGHRWHLHATFDKSGTVAPIAGTRWYELPYGMADWDFDAEADALAAFRTRARGAPGARLRTARGRRPRRKAGARGEGAP